MKHMVLNSRQENGTLSMINENQIMVQQIKLSAIQKFYYQIFAITTVFTFQYKVILLSE